MILVTLGTQKFQFNRLLKKIDEMIESGLIKEEVIAQTGFSTYIPKNYEYKDFFDKDEFKNIIEKTDIVITHSGVGTIIKSLGFNKPVIEESFAKKFLKKLPTGELFMLTFTVLLFLSKNFI